ncbi:MAG: hypothetical protein RMJ84_05130 [Sandaracinaceae bacterium]|nr:hypothetical protein [Sandaracinaceae bacterium]
MSDEAILPEGREHPNAEGDVTSPKHGGDHTTTREFGLVEHQKNLDKLSAGQEKEQGAHTKTHVGDYVITLFEKEGDGVWIRRKIAVFRRLEPGDERTIGAYPLPESPYLEALVVELRLPKTVHERMKHLAARHRAIATLQPSLIRSYDPAGWLITAGGGGAIGVWLDYLPSDWLFPLLGVGLLGVVVGVLTREAYRRAEREAKQRWETSPEFKEYDSLARALVSEWVEATGKIKREIGFHTEIRVGEGSVEPLRLASIDTRMLESEHPLFDPEDFLPTEQGGAVRYEVIYPNGRLVTRPLLGTSDVQEAEWHSPSAS